MATTANHRPAPSGPSSGMPPDALAGAALVLAFLIGPLGAGLGAWWLARRPDAGRLRVAAQAAIVVGILQTVVLAFLFFGRTPVDGSAPGTSPSPSPTYPSTPPPNSPKPDPSVTPTPVAPTAATLEEFVPPSIDSFEWDKTGVDQEALDAGAQDATQGNFTADDETITAGMAEWATSEEASAHAQESSQADFPGVEPLADGPIQSGAGHYWYFERDGVATVYWYHGKFSAQFSGDPMEVQELFLRFPR